MVFGDFSLFQEVCSKKQNSVGKNFFTVFGPVEKQNLV